MNIDIKADLIKLDFDPAAKIVSGIGANNPKLMIIQDYPTKDDVLTGNSLTGKSGAMLTRLLTAQNFEVSNSYCTSYIKFYPEGVDSHNKKLKETLIWKLKQAESFKEILVNEINTLKPNVILCLGELALNFLTGEEGIHKYRGSILTPSLLLRLNCTPKIIPTLHPRQIFQDMAALAYVPNDIKKALRFLYQKEPHKPKELIWICRNYNELCSYWSRAQYGEFLVFDIETYLGYITCISFCTDGKEAISVPLWANPNILEQTMLYKQVAIILASKIPKVNQNIKYDTHYLEKWALPVNNICGDTMLLGHTLYPELPKGLYFYTSLYTDQPYYKDEGKDYTPRLHSADQLYTYNAKDALATFQVYLGQIEDAKELKVFDFYQSKIMPLFHTYRKIDSRGILIDEERRWKLLCRYNLLELIHQQELETITNSKINANSPKQVAELIYNTMGLPQITHKKPDGTDALSTDAETLEELYINHVDSLKYDSDYKELIKKGLKEIIILRKIRTIRNYITKNTHEDGRLRTTYRLEGTKSGRTSGSSSYDNAWSINKNGKLEFMELGCSLQTLPKRPYEAEEFEGEVFGSDIPSMFVPSPGYCFVEGDGKGAEAGVVCVLAKDFETLDYMYNRKAAIKNKHGVKDDIHTLTATWCTSKKFDEITKYLRENKGKRPRHAGNYDMEAYRFSLMIHQPVHECQLILNRFHENVPKVRGVFHLTTRNLIDNQGFILTPHGRRRDFFGRKTKELYKEGFSYTPQAIVSDHTKFTLLELEDNGIDWALPIVEKHDGLLFEVPIGRHEEFAYIFKQIYERSINFKEGSFPRDFDLTIPAELTWSSDTWYDMKEIELC